VQKANCDTEYGYLYETKLIHQVPAEVRTGIFITCHAPEGVNYTVFVLVLASEFWDLLGISDSRKWNLWLQEEAEPFLGGDFVNLCQDNLSFLTPAIWERKYLLVWSQNLSLSLIIAKVDCPFALATLVLSTPTS
jgi:hypothetical protein